MTQPEGLAAGLSQPGASALLHTALAARFGQTERGRVDLAAAAGLGVSARTVRRWLRDEPGRPTVPAQRLEQVLAALRPTEITRTRERLEREHAEQGLRRIRLGTRRGNLAQWTDTGWLQPHTVAVLEVPDSGLRRVAVTRDSAATAPRIRRGVHLLDQVTVSSKFAAAIIRQGVLTHADGWRMEAGPAVVARGHTQVWLAQAPLPSLEVFASQRFRIRASALG